jgi:hypothetical protein
VFEQLALGLSEKRSPGIGKNVKCMEETLLAVVSVVITNTIVATKFESLVGARRNFDVCAKIFLAPHFNKSNACRVK